MRKVIFDGTALHAAAVDADKEEIHTVRRVVQKAGQKIMPTFDAISIYYRHGSCSTLCNNERKEGGIFGHVGCNAESVLARGRREGQSRG